MSIETWIIILCIIFISGIVKGTTGFGFALFSLPLLAHFVPIKFLIPLITLINLYSSSQIAWQLRKLKMNSFIISLSIFGVIGVIFGSLMLKFLPDLWLKLLAATVLILLSTLFLAGYRFNIRKIKRGNKIAGLVSGFLGGATSVSGPTLALFLTSMHLDTQRFRYTFAWFSIITASVAMFEYIKIGVVELHTFKIFFISLPILTASIWLGKYISTIISVRLFYTGAIIISLIAGILLFIPCFRECVLR